MKIEDLYGKSLVQIGGCGFGCVLVKNVVLTRIGYPQFEYHHALDHNDTVSEDNDFCKKVTNAGYFIWCDPSILCGHIGSTTLHVELPKIDPVQCRLKELHDQPLLPQEHVDYLWDMKYKQQIEPKVIYDIGACVLHWTNRAAGVWPNAEFIPFEAMNDVEFLYKEKGFKNYAVGCVLSDVTGEEVEFYENLEHPGGNSIYKENNELSPLADELFPENKKVKRKTNTLDDIVELNGLPKPDLIKMDIQGAELKALKGAKKTLETCNHLILELQHLDYNFGAPKAQEVIDYLKTIGFEMVGNKMFCGSSLGVDGDYHFIKTHHHQ
jgi:FkbM family methyltransferase